MMRLAAASLRTAFALALLVPGAAAQARTCTVDLDQLQRIRAELTRLVKGSVRVDGAEAKGLAHKYLEQLEAGKLALDKRDLKRVVPSDRRPSPAEIVQLLAEVQGVVKSCEESAVGNP